jgi:chromatin assembly factor 1 subunit B
MNRWLGAIILTGLNINLKIWMVHPNILPPEAVVGASTSTLGAKGDIPAPRPPRVEYLATLSRHSAAVNVVRFSPNGKSLSQCQGR